MQSLVASSESTFVWHVIKDDAAGESYAVSLTPVAVQQRARQREEERALKRTRRRQSQGREQTEEASAATFNAHQQRAAAKAGAQRAAVQEEEEEEDPIDLLELPEHDESASHLIVLRRLTHGRVFEQELAAAQYFRVRKGQLRRCPSGSGCSTSRHRRHPRSPHVGCQSGFAPRSPLLASVRIVGAPIASAPSAAAMMARLVTLPVRAPQSLWGQGHTQNVAILYAGRCAWRLISRKRNRGTPFHPRGAPASLARTGAR